MANNNGGNISFGVKFNADTSSLNKLKSALQDIQKAVPSDLLDKSLNTQQADAALQKIKKSAQEVEQALQKAYNPTLDSVNISKFNNALSQSNLSLTSVYKDLSQIEGGASAFRNLTSEVLTTNLALKKTTSFVDQIGTTLANTVKWNIASSAVNGFTSAIGNAYNYIKVLDTSLTDIRIVTGDSRAQMDKFADSANRAAASLGRQTKDYTNAALTFYQQGLSDDEVKTRTEAALKASNITGENAEEMANELTAVWNGFQVSMEDSEKVVSKMAAVADTSASDMSELATAMSKTASVANNMGVNIDQMNAMLATTIQVTRQAPETVGNAYKTILTRINDIQAGTEDAETTLGNYSSKMASLGINVLDATGHLRDTGDVMTEIGEKWQNMTKEQQVYLAQTMAGQRQMNNLIALFDNWDVYTKELNTSLEANNELNEKNDIYMESLAAHTKQLQAAQEGLIQSLADSDSFKNVIDIGTTALKLLTQLSDSVGGGGTALLGLGSILSKVFNKTIVNQISDVVFRIQDLRENAEALKSAREQINELFSGLQINDLATEQLIGWKQQVLDFGNIVSEQEQNQANEIIKTRNSLQNQKQAWDEAKKAAEDFYKANTGKNANIDLTGGESRHNLVLLANLDSIEKAADRTTAKAQRLEGQIQELDNVSLDKVSNEFTNLAEDIIKNNKGSKQAVEEVKYALTEYQNAVQAAKKNGLKGQDIFNDIDVKDSLSGLLSAVGDANTEISAQARQTAQTVKQASKGTEAQIQGDINKCKSSWDNFINRLKTKSAVQNVTNLLRGVTQLAFGIQTLSNLPNIISDDSLSSGEKALQVVSALSMAVPSLISGIREVGAAAVGLAATHPEILALMAAIAAVTVAITAAYKAYNKDAEALKQAQKDATALADRYDELKKKYDDLKTSIADYQDQKDALSKLTEGTDEWNEKVKELNHNVTELIQLYPELAQYVKTVNGQLTLSQEGIDKIEKEAANALSQAEADSIGGTIAVNNAQNKSDLTNTSRQITYMQEGVSGTGQPTGQLVSATVEQTQKVLDAYNKNTALFGEDIQTFMKETGIQSEALAQAFKDNYDRIDKLATSIDNNTKANEVLSEQLVHAGNSDFGNEDYNNSEHQDIIDKVIADRAQELLPALQEQYADKGKFGGGMSDKQIQQQYAESRGYTGSKNKFGNVADYYTTSGQTLTISDSQARNALAQDKALEQAQDKLLQTTIDNINNIVSEGNKVRDKVGDILAEFYNGAENADLSKYSQQQIKAFEEALNSNKIDLSQYAQEFGYESGDELKNAIQERVGAYFSDELPQQAQNSLSKIQQIYGALSNYSEDLLAGKELKDDDLADYLDKLKQIEQEYPQLAAQASMLQQTWLQGTDEYNNALKDLMNSLDEIESQQLESSISQGLENLYKDNDGNTITFTAALDEDTFDDEVNAILGQDYELTIKVYADAEDSLNDLQSEISDITDAASKIGEGFIVANDDIRELNNAFPGILQGYKDLADGTIQLNQQVVQSAIATAEAEVGADTQSTAQKVQNAIQELKAKQEIYQGIADAAGALAAAEQKGTEDTTSLKKKLESEVAKLDASSKKEQQQNAGKLATNSNSNAKTTGDNWKAAYQEAAQAAYEFAKTAQSAHTIATTGEGTPYKANFGNIQYKGSTGTQADITDSTIDNLMNSMDSSNVYENAAAIQQAAQAAADALGKKVDDLEGALVQNSASLNDFHQGLQNVSSGKDFTPSDKNEGKSSKGKSGGSSKEPKSADPKSADEVLTKQDKEQIDRYHKLDRAIKDLTDTINHLSKAEDKTIRNGTVKMIDKEIAGLQQEVALYNKKHQAVLEDIKTQAGVVKGLGAQLDAQGNIVNYYQLLTKWQDAYNARIQKAAQMTDKAQQDAELKAAEIDKKNYDSWKKTIENYENLQDTLRDVEDQLQDIADQEEELRIKQFKIKVDVELDINQARRDWNVFQKEVVKQIKDDDYLGQANAAIANFSTYYNEKGTGDVQALTERVSQIHKEAQIIENGETSSIYGRNEKQALDDLNDALNQLYSSMKAVVDLRKEVKDAYLNQIDQAKEEFDQQITTYEQIDSLIEHDINMLNLLHPRNDDYDALDKWYKKRSENYNQEIDFYRKEANMWKAQMDNAKKGSDEWKKFRDNWMDSISGLNEAVEAATKNLIEKYQNTVTKIMKQTKDSVAGGDWDKALSEWDKRKWQDDRYLDIASRATGVLDFQDAVNDAMKNQSPKVQKQLADFLDKEINDLNSITNLRQIDLDIANKKLAVIQKQIALEDVQNAKTTMRLRRDSQGNYTYQYVADEDQTQTKQKELRDAVEELRLLVKNDLTDTMDEAYQKMDEYFEKATEIANEYYDDQELMKQKLHDLEEEYFGEDGYITLLDADYIRGQGDLVEATGAELDVLYAEQGDKLKSFLGLDNDAEGDSIWGSILQLISADGTSGKIPDLLNNFTNGTYTTNFQNMDDISKNFLFGDTGLMPSWDTAFDGMMQKVDELVQDKILPANDELIDAAQEYQDDLDELEQAAGEDFDSIEEGIDRDIDATQELIENNDDLISKYEDLINKLGDAVKAIDALIDGYNKARDAAIAAAEAAEKFYEAAQGRDIDTSNIHMPTPNVPVTPQDTSQTTASTSGGGGGVPHTSSGSKNNNTGGGSKKTTNSSPKKNTGSDMRTIDIANDPGGKKHKLTTSDINSNNYKFDYIGGMGGSNDQYIVKIKDTSGRWQTVGYTNTDKWRVGTYDTGGYTGEWANGSKSGRLAFLHQKELVLNQEDTKNTLKAVKIASGLINSLSGLGSNMLNNLYAGRSLGGLSSGENGTLEQEVHITAEFPNANSAQEIEKALNNLVNAAAQHASINRRKY